MHSTVGIPVVNGGEDVKRASKPSACTFLAAARDCSRHFNTLRLLGVACRLALKQGVVPYNTLWDHPNSWR